MLTILIRTLIIYAALIVTMRFMGKRQLGELEVTDLVITLLLSEVATLPLTNTEIPLSHALVPILSLMSLEVLLSGALLRFPAFKKFFSVRPAILVKGGKPMQRTLSAMRISTEELLSQLRLKDVTDLSEVAYAILEPNGQVSIVKRATARQPTTREMGVSPPESGMMHLIVSDGKITPQSLALAGRDVRWLREILEAHKLTQEEIFLLLVDDGGTVRIYPREEVSS